MKMHKGNLNGSKLCSMRWILMKIIRLGIYYLDRLEITLLSVDGYIRPNSPLMVFLSIAKIIWSWKDYLNKNELTTLRPFTLLQRWTWFDWFFPSLLALDGRFMRWTLKVPFFMVICLKISLWSNPLVLWHIPLLFVDSRSYCMVWIRPLGLGMRRLISYFSILVSNIVNIIIISMYCMLKVIHWFLLYMLMIRS